MRSVPWQRRAVNSYTGNVVATTFAGSRLAEQPVSKISTQSKRSVRFIIIYHHHNYTTFVKNISPERCIAPGCVVILWVYCL